MKGSYDSSYPPLLNVRDPNYHDDASIAHFARGNSIFQIQAGGIYHKRGTGDTMELKTSSGHVFFGNSTQNKYIRFATNGTIAPSTSFSSAYSDDRIKFNETDVSNCLSIVRQLSSPQRYERFIPQEKNDQTQAFPTDASWNEIQNMSEISVFDGFISDFQNNLSHYKGYYDSSKLSIDSKDINLILNYFTNSSNYFFSHPYLYLLRQYRYNLIYC